MKSIRMLAAAAALGSITACGAGNDAADNFDANATLKENLDPGLNTTDPNATTDLNAATDVNATDLNATNAVDANVSGSATNATTNNTL